MKTMEVEVMVPLIVTKGFARAEIFKEKTRDMSEEAWFKARLIIELPEKKIEITESLLLEVFDNLEPFSKGNNRWVNIDDLHKKLFGDEK